eukprot:3766683-Amphidinium_carterae.1
MEETLCRFAEVGRSLSRSEINDVACLTEVWKAFQSAVICDLLDRYVGCPVLYQYSSDCTPSSTRVHVSATSGSGVGSVRSSQRRSSELYVQAMYVSIAIDEVTVVRRLIFREPHVLRHGKKMIALLALARQFVAGSWCRGSEEDVTLFMHVSDRGMSHKFRQAVSALMREASTHCISQAAIPEDLKDMYQMHFSSSCGLHDSHNSLKWGFQTVCSDHVEKCKVMYSVIASFRPATTYALAYLPQWFDIVLEILPDEQCVDGSLLYEVYACLGVRADILDMMSYEMRVSWDPIRTRLQVAASFMSREASVSDLSYVLTLCWKFPQFCSSRWMTIGCSTRCLVLGVATGFGHMYKCLRKEALIGDYDGRAGDSLDGELCSLAVVLGISAYPAESLIGLLLHDGRVLQQMDELQDVLHEESLHVESLSPDAWTLLSKYSSMGARQLRHNVIHCMSVSTAYIRHRFINQFLEPPWTLTQNDVNENLVLLQGCDEPPVECNTYKIWFLLRRGYSISKMKRCMYLLRDSVFHSHFAERMHASAAVLSRKHDYTADTRVTRAFIHTLRCSETWIRTFPNPPKKGFYYEGIIKPDFAFYISQGICLHDSTLLVAQVVAPLNAGRPCSRGEITEAFVQVEAFMS